MCPDSQPASAIAVLIEIDRTRRRQLTNRLLVKIHRIFDPAQGVADDLSQYT